MKHAICALVAASAFVVAPASIGQAAGLQVQGAAHLHSGEFCSKKKQKYYHRHGYTCRRASDGRNRLFKY